MPADTPVLAPSGAVPSEVLTALRPLVGPDSGDDVLTAVLRTVITLVPGADGATLCRRRGRDARPRSVAATGPAFRALDIVQLRSGRGPVLDAHLRRERVGGTVAPVDGSAPSRTTGALSIPLYDGTPDDTSVLTLYGPALPRSDDAPVHLLVGVLEVALTALAHRERTRHLEHAVQSNRRIGMALGVLMAYGRGTELQAFAAISEASQALNRKVVDLADHVILTGALPSPVPEGGLPAPRPATP